MFFEKTLEPGTQTALEPRAKIAENLFWIRGIDTPPVLIEIKKEPQIGAPLAGH